MSGPRAGVIGHPISHSLSPKLHGFWLEKYKIAGEYKAYDVMPEKLEFFLREKARDGFAGFNITIPYKETVMNIIDEIDATATKIGAVNTIVIKNGRLIGSNTDAYGFAENIREHIRQSGRAMVLGAGGASKAVVMALKQLGFGEIVITNRTKEKSQSLASRHGVAMVEWEKKEERFHDLDLLVNTTSLGLSGSDALEINLETLPKKTLVTDIVYSPLMTPLLVAARDRGNPIADGLGMLLHQAVPGFEAWFGRKPKVTDELRHAVLTP